MKDREMREGNGRAKLPKGTLGNLASKVGAPPGGFDTVDSLMRYLTLAAKIVGEGMCITDATGRIKFANPVLERMLGYDSGELEGKSLFALYPGGESDSKPQGVVDGLRNGGWSREGTLQTKRGREIRAYETGLVLWDSAGDLVGYVCTNVEMGGREQTEEALIRLGSIVESSDDAIMGLTLDNVIVNWNPGAERLYGYSVDEIVGRPLDVIIPSSRSHKMAELIDRIRQGERIVQFETVDQTKDGRLIDVSLTISPVRDRAGNLTGVSAIARDITEQKRGEVALRLRTQEQEALFKIARVLSLPGSFEEKVSQVMEEVVGAVEADMAVLRVPDEQQEHLHLVASAPKDYKGSTKAPTIPFEGTLSGRCFESGQPLVVNDYRSHSQAWPPFLEQGLESVVLLPIKAEGQTLGVITVDSFERDHFNSERVRLLTAISNEVGALLENARLNEENKKALKRQTALLEASRPISTSFDTPAILSGLAQAMCQGLDATSVYICDLDRDTGGSTVLAEYISSQAKAEEWDSDIGSTYNVQRDTPGFIDHMLSVGMEVVHVDDPELNDVDREHMLKFGARTTLTVPLKVGDRLFGYVEVWESRRRREF
ncbi:MAG: PAS domain S-box protein, partial [Dehalococcoidia bacterium]